MKAKVTRIGPYSSPDVVRKLDGRTRQAKLMAQLRFELMAHVGNRPSATQQALINRAVALQLHVSAFDAKALATGGVLSEADSKQYLAWSNSLVRALDLLGFEQRPAERIPLNERLRGAA